MNNVGWIRRVPRRNPPHGLVDYARSANLPYIWLSAFFLLLAFALLAPIASNTYVPNFPDFANNIVAISQAKAAWLEGQFPLRVTPDLYQDWRYPYFQFYAPFVYLLGGVLHLIFSPHNSFIAVKMVLIIGMLLGGIYFYRLVLFMLRTNALFLDKKIALLSAVVYVSAPYLIVEMVARGDLTESFAICLIPAVLFYSLQLLYQPRLRIFICCALAWVFLLMSHLITFLTATFFIFLFLIIININDAIPLKRIVWVIVAYVYSILLGLWYLAPVVLLHDNLYTQYGLDNPSHYTWLTPLSTLLSMTSVSPMPLPGNGKLTIPFYLSVGWPILLGVGVVLYNRFRLAKAPLQPMTFALLVIFFLSFFAVLSPVDFWSYLPHNVQVMQFSFRLLAHLVWSGALLFALALTTLYQKSISLKEAVGILLIILLAHSSWLKTAPSMTKTVAEIAAHPQWYELGTYSFIVNPGFLKEPLIAKSQLSSIPVKCNQIHQQTQCQVKTKYAESWVQLPILFYPDLLQVKLDQKNIAYQASLAREIRAADIPKKFQPVLATILVPQGTHEITIEFCGLRWANRITFFAWISGCVALLYAGRRVFYKTRR